MNFAILYGQGALDQLLGLKLPEILDCVDRAMDRLADNPDQYSYFDLNERELCVINLTAKPDFTL